VRVVAGMAVRQPPTSQTHRKEGGAETIHDCSRPAVGNKPLLELHVDQPIWETFLTDAYPFEHSVALKLVQYKIGEHYPYKTIE